MIFNKGDYISGIETAGTDGFKQSREMRGWVDEVGTNSISIRADDGYDGNRGTIVDKETAYRCNRVQNWREALNRQIQPGAVVRHFEGNLYKVIGFADHVDGGRVVIYMALYGEYKVYVREYSEFMSLVDKKKYPNIEQKYRFEEV